MNNQPGANLDSIFNFNNINNNNNPANINILNDCSKTAVVDQHTAIASGGGRRPQVLGQHMQERGSGRV